MSVLGRITLVAAGGALGAMARYLLSGWVARLSQESAFPWGTLAVNVAGSFLLGLLMGAGSEGRFLVPPGVQILVGVGFLGALTTFSTFSYEAIEAWRVGDSRIALGYVAANLAGALAACWLGLGVGERI